MKVETKRAILKYVQHKDPGGFVVSLKPSSDFKGGRIRFSAEMTQHRQETNLSGEKYAEAYLLVKLVEELGYESSRIELQKEYELGRPEKLNKPRNDIIVNRGDGTPFFFIEVKDPSEYDADAEMSLQFQLFALANQEREKNLKYLVYATVDMDAGELVPRIKIIDFERYRSYEDWLHQGSFALDILPASYGKAYKAQFVRKDRDALAENEKNLNITSGPETFAAIRQNLHDVLWAGGGMFYNDIFTNLVKLFLAKYMTK